jgi:chemotaxis receptor (MCP) glutamine deamidase CheD
MEHCLALAKKHWVVSTAGVVLGKVVDLLLLDVSDMVSGMVEIIMPEAESKVNLGLLLTQNAAAISRILKMKHAYITSSHTRW